MTFCFLGVPLTLPLYLSLQWSKKVYPGAVNSVPRESHVEVDVRDIEEKRRDHVLDMVIKSAEQIADKRQCEMKYRIVNKDPPAPCADDVVAAVQVRPMPFIFPIRPSLLSRLSDPYPRSPSFTAGCCRRSQGAGAPRLLSDVPDAAWH